MKKSNPKIRLTSAQRDFIETVGSNVNNRYYFFPLIYKKIDGTYEFEEMELSDCPEGVQKYIKEKLGNTK